MSLEHLSTTVDNPAGFDDAAPVCHERSHAGFGPAGVEISRADTGERFDVHVIRTVPAEVRP